MLSSFMPWPSGCVWASAMLLLGLRNEMVVEAFELAAGCFGDGSCCGFLGAFGSGAGCDADGC